MVREINKELKKRNKDNYVSFKAHDKKNLSLIILLVTYVILIGMFIICDFLEIKFPIYLKYVILFIACVTMIVESVRMVTSKKNTIAKGICIALSVVLLVLVIGINYRPFIEAYKEYNIELTNLSEVFIDGLTIGDSVEKFDDKKYMVTDRYSDNNYNLIYEEIMINEKDKRINRIYGQAKQVNIRINGQEISTDLEDLVSKLGDNYIKTYVDDEQILYQYTYLDKVNNIKVSFQYRDNESNPINYQFEYVVIGKR